MSSPIRKVATPKMRVQSGPSPARIPVAPPVEPGSTPPVLLPLEELVLDPALQCRAGGTQPAKVDEYAELMADGVELGALQVVLVDDCVEPPQYLVVDGFHRHPAAVRAGRTEYPCIVTVGTRRDAVLAAAKANDRHGIPRTDADKRNAVRLLLMDEECCALASRPLGALAGVSHRLVQRVRDHYGVPPGVLLTVELAARVDAWSELLAAAQPSQRPAIVRIREASGPAELVAVGFATEHLRAHLLRRRELAFRPWPWNDLSPAAMEARAARLDDIEEIVQALGAADCPRMGELYQVLFDHRRVHERGYNLPAVEVRWRGRPRLHALVTELLEAEEEERRQREAGSPYNVAARIQRTEDPAEQAELIRAAPPQVVQYLHAPKLPPAVRDGVYLERLAPKATVRCADPRCDGWAEDVRSTCKACGLNVGMRAHFLRDAEETLGELVRSGLYGLPVGDVVVDALSVDLLAAITATVKAGTTSWIGTCPPQLARVLRVWSTRPEAPGLPEVVERAAEDLDGEDGR